MNSRIFKVVAIFEKPHSILLDLLKDRLYLISIFYNTYLGFPEDHKLHVTLWTLLSYPNNES